MKTNKLLAAVAVLALVVAAAAVIITPAAAANDNVTVTDVQYQEEKTRLLVTLSDSYLSTPAEVTVSGDALEAPIKTKAFINNASKFFVSLLKNTLEDGTYTIQIDNLPAYDFVVSDEPVITSITATAAKTSYFVGESFDATGLVVTANYAAGEPAVLPASDYTYAPAGALALTDTKVTVTLVADEKITTEVPITVKEKQVLVNVTFQISEGFTKTVPAIVGQAVEPIAEPKIEGAAFVGWFLADATEPFNFDTPIAGETTLYAHFGPEAPSTEQTKKFVGAISEDCTLVVTAYDGNIVGKGTAKVQIYEEMNIGGYMMYVPVKDAVITVEMDSNNVYFVEDLNDAIRELITESGNYALMAQITLENGMIQTTNYETFVL